MDGIQPTFNMGNDGGSFGGNGLWLFAILALLWGGNGFFGGRDGRAATTEDVNTSANFTRLESQVNANGAAVDRAKDTINNGICDLGYETAKQFGQTNMLIQEKSGQLSKEILESRYLTEKALLQQSCEIKTMLQQNKIDALQARVNQLELANATAGVFRFPSQMVYASPCNPFCPGTSTGNTTTPAA